MKKTALLSSVILIIALILVFQLKQGKEKSVQEFESEMTHESRSLYWEKYYEWEESILKDPLTGKIPEGIHEREFAFAKKIIPAERMYARGMISTWIPKGPTNSGGRTRAVKFDISDPSGNTMLAASASGGVFRTTNGGASWTRVSPNNQYSGATCLAQDPRPGFQHIWYYGTGEFIGNSASAPGGSYRGQGIWRSANGGITWTQIPLTRSNGINNLIPYNYCSSLAVDPTNGDLYVGASGILNKLTLNGNQWTEMYMLGAFALAVPVDVIAANDGTIYAAIAGSRDSNLGFIENTNEGFWKKNRFSISFSKIAGTGGSNTPAGWNTATSYGRTVLGMSSLSGDQNMIYVLYWNNTRHDGSNTATAEGELFRYNDKDNTWTAFPLPDDPGKNSLGNDPFACQSGYDLAIAVKPDGIGDGAADIVFIGGTNAYRSLNGGTNWTRIGGYATSFSYQEYSHHHPDIHAFAFHPLNSNIMLCANDGGIYITSNNEASGVAWTDIGKNYQTYQYYDVALDQAPGSARCIGGAQDNGTTWVNNNSSNHAFFPGGGDGSGVAIANGSDYVYFTTQFGKLFRSKMAPVTGILFNLIEIEPAGTFGSNQFLNVMRMDPVNSKVLYWAYSEGTFGGANRIYRTNDAVSVTEDDWTDLLSVSSAIGTGPFVITTLEAATHRVNDYSALRSKLYIGMSNGRIYKVSDPQNGKSPLVTDISPAILAGGNITGNGRTNGATCIDIAANPVNEDEIIAVYSNYNAASILLSRNAGATWVNIGGNLEAPDGPSVRSAAIISNPADPLNQTSYYAGTSTGLYSISRSVIGTGSGATWVQEGMPEIGNVPVVSLSARNSDNTLLAGTHGRGMFITSNVSLPVQFLNFTASVFEKRNALLKWSTAFENNSRVFEIERSTDGINYKYLASVTAAGTSNEIKEYSFTDRTVPEGVKKMYYRLKLIDRDGNFTYSDTLSVEFEMEYKEPVVSPAVFKTGFDVYINPGTAGVKMIILNSAGALIKQQTLTEARTHIDLPAVSAGVYIIRTIDENGNRHVRRVIKQ